MSHHGYANDTALVDADWARAHLDDPNVRFVEVDVDTTAYEQSHLPGAVAWDWTSQLADGVRRDIASRADFSALLSASGIGPDRIRALSPPFIEGADYGTRASTVIVVDAQGHVVIRERRFGPRGTPIGSSELDFRLDADALVAPGGSSEAA